MHYTNSYEFLFQLSVIHTLYMQIKLKNYNKLFYFKI